MIAEAPWKDRLQQNAVGYTLIYRWKLAKRKRENPDMKLSDLIQEYCKAFQTKRKWRLTRRMKWLRTIDDTGVRPRFFPKRLKWDKAFIDFKDAVRRARLIMRGKIKDPCRGQAIHFGHVTLDKPNMKRLRLLNDVCFFGGNNKTNYTVFYGRKGRK